MFAQKIDARLVEIVIVLIVLAGAGLVHLLKALVRKADSSDRSHSFPVPPRPPRPRVWMGQEEIDQVLEENLEPTPGEMRPEQWIPGTEVVVLRPPSLPQGA